jgi:tRNA 2-thiouridine synthesizing protein B
MLFTVNKSPFGTDHLQSALAFAPKGSPVLLYEDGVYAALEGTRTAELVKSALKDHGIYALQADLEARGLNVAGQAEPSRLIDGIQVIGYDGFVELVEQHDVAPWL